MSNLFYVLTSHSFLLFFFFANIWFLNETIVSILTHVLSSIIENGHFQIVQTQMKSSVCVLNPNMKLLPAITLVNISHSCLVNVFNIRFFKCCSVIFPYLHSIKCSPNDPH